MPDGVKAGTAYVDVDADLAKLKKTVDQGIPKAIDGAAQKGAQQASSRFAGIGSHLKKGILGSLGGVTGIAVGGGITAIGASLDALAGPAEQAKKQLEATFTAGGFSIDKFKGQIASTERQMENYGHTNADTDTALRKLTTAFQDPKKALQEMGLVANIAAANHISLADAASLDVKAHAGSTKIFKQFGINVSLVKNPLAAVTKAEGLATKAHSAYATATQRLAQLQLVDHLKKKLTVSDYIALKNVQDKVNTTGRAYYVSLVNIGKAHVAATKNSHLLDGAFATLAKRVKGQAGAAVDSFSGKLEVWKTKIQDVAAKWGAKLGPILTTAGPLIAGLGGILSSGLVPALGATTTAEEGAAVATNSMLLPVTAIIVGLAALTAGVIYAYNHWTGFRNVVDAVGRWLRDVLWPIIQHVAADIWTVFKIYLGAVRVEWMVLWAVAKWIWDNVAVPIFDGARVVIGTFVNDAINVWRVLQPVFLALWVGLRAIWNAVGVPIFDAIRTVIGDLVGAFQAIEGPIAAVFSGIAGGVHAAMRAAVHVFFLGVNTFLSIAKGMADAYNSIPGVPHIQGIHTISEPSFHQGGIFHAPAGRTEGLALLRDGERVLTPEQDQARSRSDNRPVTNIFNMTAGMTADQVLAAQRREERLFAHV